MKIRPILALAATARSLFAACSGAARRRPRPPRRRRVRRHHSPRARPQRPHSGAGTGDGSTAAPVGAAGPVRGLLRGREAGLLRRRGPRRDDRSPAARSSSRRSQARRPTAPSSRSAGCPKVLEAREQGSDLVNIAQIFQRSGTLSVSWADSGITGPADFAGKKIGVWDFGNEFEVTAGALTAGLVAGHRLHEGHPAVRHVAPAQPADRRRRGDDLQRVRAGPRGDQPRHRRPVPALRPQRHQLERRRHGDAPGRAVRPGQRGWMRPATGRRGPLPRRRSRAGSTAGTTRPTASSTRSTPARTLGSGHQAWMMNEINALVWPSPVGDRRGRSRSAGPQTVEVSLDAGIIKGQRRPADAYGPTSAEAALAGIDASMDRRAPTS